MRNEQLSVESNPGFLSFFTSLCDWSRLLAPLSKPIRFKANHDLVARIFPRLRQFVCLRVFSFLLIGLWYHFSFGFATLLRKALYLVDYPFTFNYQFHTLTRPLCRKIHHVDRFLLPSFSPHSCLHQLLT